MKFLDLNNDGQFNSADVVLLFKDEELLKNLGSLVGYGVLQSNSTTDDDVLVALTDVLDSASEVILAKKPVTRRQYIDKGIAVLESINKQANPQSPIARYTSGALVGARAMYERLDLTDGTQEGEVAIAIGAMLTPILGSLFAGGLGR